MAISWLTFILESGKGYITDEEKFSIKFTYKLDKDDRFVVDKILGSGTFNKSDVSITAPIVEKYPHIELDKHNEATPVVRVKNSDADISYTVVYEYPMKKPKDEYEKWSNDKEVVQNVLDYFINDRFPKEVRKILHNAKVYRSYKHGFYALIDKYVKDNKEFEGIFKLGKQLANKHTRYIQVKTMKAKAYISNWNIAFDINTRGRTEELFKVYFDSSDVFINHDYIKTILPILFRLLSSKSSEFISDVAVQLYSMTNIGNKQQDILNAIKSTKAFDAEITKPLKAPFIQAIAKKIDEDAGQLVNHLLQICD